MVENKIKSLLRAYKAAEDNASKTGAGASKGPYDDLLDDIFGIKVCKPSNITHIGAVGVKRVKVCETSSKYFFLNPSKLFLYCNISFRSSMNSSPTFVVESQSSEMFESLSADTFDHQEPGPSRQPLEQNDPCWALQSYEENELGPCTATPPKKRKASTMDKVLATLKWKEEEKNKRFNEKMEFLKKKEEERKKWREELLDLLKN